MVKLSLSRWHWVLGTLQVAAWLFCGLVYGQEPEVLVELGKSRVFEGQSVRYTVLLNHFDSSVEPSLPKTDDLQFRLTGKGTVRKMTFDGFKRTVIEGTNFEYVLTPTRSGEIEVPGPTVTVGKNTYRGSALKLQVVAANSQDLAVLEVAVDRNSVYPLQPFTLRLTVALKALPAPHTEKDPLLGAGEVPMLAIPWADDEKLPDGVNAETPAQRWLQALIAQGRRPIGFGINDLQLSSDLFSVFDRRRAMFHPEPQRVKRKDASGRTVDYWEYTFERELTASKLGKLSFGPVTLKGAFAHRATTAGEVEVAEVYAVAKPLVIEVQGPPSEGRPASYINAVGRFEVEPSLTPSSVKVGDPMTLSLRVHGTGALDDATPPKLDQVPAVADSFKVYEPTEESAKGERIFKYNLRPKKAGITEFPSIELAYFDFDEEKYVTLKTSPVKIEVSESDHLANQDIAMSAAQSSAASSAIETSAEGIFANITDLRQLRDERVRPDTWFLSLGSMAGLFVVCGLVTRQAKRRRNDPVHQRRRAASKKAWNALSDARRLAAAGSRRETVEALGAAITRFVADAIGRAESGMTSRDISRELATVGVTDEFISRCQRLLDEFDAARYGDSSHRLDEQVSATEQLLSDLIRELRQRKLAV